ncbi:hypothetical protein Tco_1192679 [Tanacetum coccineum]
MNNKKHILGLDQFRDILQICPKVGNKKFEEPPLEKEILAFLAIYLNKCPSVAHLILLIVFRLSQAQILWGMYNKKNVDYAYLLWEDFTYQIENKNTKEGQCDVNWHYARDDPMFTTINVISRNEDTQLYGAILPTELTNEDIRISESYKEYHAIASGKIPPKTKGSKKKADTDTTTKMKPPTVPKEKKEKKSRKGKQKTTELETISEAVLTEAEQLKIITKRSRKETHSSHASGSGADEGTDDEKAQDDEDDDVHDDDENAQDDDDEEQTESEDDGDDFIHPKLTTHDDEIIHEEETDEEIPSSPKVPHTLFNISTTDDKDIDKEVEGTNVKIAKSDEDANITKRIKEMRRQKALEDNFFASRTHTTNQYAEALSPIHASVDHYLANKMQDTTFIGSSYKALVEAVEATKSARYLWRYGHNKKTSRCADDDQEPSAGTDRGSKRRRLPSPDHAWKKTVPAHFMNRPTFAKQIWQEDKDPRESFR